MTESYSLTMSLDMDEVAALHPGGNGGLLGHGGVFGGDEKIFADLCRQPQIAGLGGFAEGLVKVCLAGLRARSARESKS
jgi:hypothetical protein